jgi:hypothetical protein
MESTIPGVWLYILEAIQDLDEVFADIERAGGMISGYKCLFICEGLRIVAFVCDSEGHHREIEKVRKIVEWPACRSVTESRAFIAICVYYRAWIRDFSIVAEPIFELFRHSRGDRVISGDAMPGKQRKRKATELEEFAWGQEQAEAMSSLGDALVTAPALLPLTYMPEVDGFVGKIVLGVDMCGLGFGTIL